MVTVSQAAHERAYDTWVDIPADTASVWDDGSPIDSGTAMILASNEAHLCVESLRHHVLDVAPISLARSAGKTTWDGVQDVAGPSAADIAALPADEGYKGVSWMRYFCKWGPLFVPMDRVAASGNLVIRTLKGQFRFVNTAGTAAYAHVALTTHSDPEQIALGNVSYYSKNTITGAGNQSFSVTMEADIRDAIRENIPARRGTTSVGATQFGCIPVYIWLCVDSECTNLASVSIWESRV